MAMLTDLTEEMPPDLEARFAPVLEQSHALGFVVKGIRRLIEAGIQLMLVSFPEFSMSQFTPGSRQPW